MTTPEVDDSVDIAVKVELKSDDEECNSKEERKQRKRHYDDKVREDMSDEQRRQKRSEYDRKRRTNSTPEQRAKKREQSRKRRANATPEQRAKERERSRKRREELRAKGLPLPRYPRRPLSDKSLMKEKERHSRYIHQETPEQRQKRLAQQKESRRKYFARLTDEQRREYQIRRYFQRKAREANMSKEEREESLRKMAEHNRNYVKNLPPGEKEKYKEKMRANLKKQMQKRWKEEPEKLLEYYRGKIAAETPEQRQVRLRRYKINAARRKLKKQLQDEGVLSVEDVEKRCEELVEKMKSEPLPPPTTEALSQYKPRPSGRKPKKMTVKPPGRKSQNVVQSTPNYYNNWQKGKSSSGGEYNYTPMPSRRKPKKWGIMYELEMQGKGAQTNSKSDTTSTSTPPVIASTKNEVQISAFDDDCPSSPVDGDDYFCANAYDDDDGNYESSQRENLTPPLQPNCCTLCFQTFETETGLSSHITVDHPWRCPICSERILNSSQLVSHFNTKHSKDQLNFVCMRCPWNVENLSENSCFWSHKDLLQHVQHHHPSNYWPCPTCNLLLYSESRFNSHFAVCTTALQLKLAQRFPLLCGTCGKSFDCSGKYQCHVNYFHHPDKEKFTCPNCGKYCSYSRSFWHHFVKCTKLMPGLDKKGNQLKKLSSSELQERRKLGRIKTGPIPCDQCGKTFTQKCTLDDHIRRDHKGESYVCPQCGKKFQSAGKQWRHQAEIHGLTDLPPPPGVEVLRCLYCQDFIMRGYEFHVKKKHPEHWEIFRANEFPKIREKLQQVRFKNPKRQFSKTFNCNAWKEITDEYGELKKVYNYYDATKVHCPICSVVISQGNLKRHMKRFHKNSPLSDARSQLKNEPVKCSICDSILANAEQLGYHYAEMHAYDGIEQKLLLKNLITKRCPSPSRRSYQRIDAVCSICNIVLRMDRFSVRVHFLASHYDQFLEVLESGDATALAV